MKDYELIDAGGLEKLERFGDVVVRRPEPQALFPKKLDEGEWKKADAEFLGTGKGKWKFNRELDKEWQIILEDISFELKFAVSNNAFKHLGIFPEQYSNWKWIKESIQKETLRGLTPQILNLFAYTGGATIAALQAGAQVTHVDASSGAIEWAKRNAELSGVSDKPVRWMVDDARKFIEKEIRRGVKYHGIILDPPSYGKGPKKEIWDIEKDFLELIESVKKLLHHEPLFVLLNGYSAGYSSLAYAENLSSLKVKFGGEIESGELLLESKSGMKLPAGIFARWRK